MLRRAPLLAATLLIFASVPHIADAKGGRTTIADCKAGSADPDCPDEPDASSDDGAPRNGATAGGQQPAAPPVASAPDHRTPPGSRA